MGDVALGGGECARVATGEGEDPTGRRSRAMAAAHARHGSVQGKKKGEGMVVREIERQGVMHKVEELC
jgi:hypothetical protein